LGQADILDVATEGGEGSEESGEEEGAEEGDDEDLTWLPLL